MAQMRNMRGRYIGLRDLPVLGSGHSAVRAPRQRLVSLTVSVAGESDAVNTLMQELRSASNGIAIGVDDFRTVCLKLIAEHGAAMNDAVTTVASKVVIVG